MPPYPVFCLMVISFKPRVAALDAEIWEQEENQLEEAQERDKVKQDGCLACILHSIHPPFNQTALH